MPRVSVIIPTYNRSAYLKQAVESVLAQTYTDYEIIVVDDGSTDDTPQVMRTFGDLLRYVCIAHSGRSAARNRGIRLARGEFISFLDSDDIFLPRKLELQIAVLEEHPEVGMVYSSALVIDDRGQELPKSYVATASGGIYHQIAFYLPVTVLLPTVTVRSDALARVGDFDEKMERFEDTDMWRRVSKRYAIWGMREPLTKIRTHSGNSMEDPQQVLESIRYYVAKIDREDRDTSTVFRRKGASNLYGHYGKAILVQGRGPHFARRFLIEAIKSWPLGFQFYGLLAGTFLFNQSGWDRAIAVWRKLKGLAIR